MGKDGLENLRHIEDNRRKGEQRINLLNEFMWIDSRTGNKMGGKMSKIT